MAAQHVFSDTDIELVSAEKEYPEIQANSSLGIARFTAQQVAKELGAPALREDHSLCLNGLKQVPGPYMNYFNSRLNEDDILKLHKNINNRSGYFEVATVLAFPDDKLLESEFKVNFTLAFESRGTLQSGWNRIIVLEGETRTLAEYPESDRIDIWNRGYLNILTQLQDLPR